MAELTITTFVSLDGVMQAPGGPGEDDIHDIGKRLFGSGAAPRTLKLVKSNTTSTGVMICVYRPAGSLKTGSFALD